MPAGRNELLMTGSGIHAWVVLSLIGGRSAFAYQEIAPILEIIHVLGNSYRLASSGLVSSVLCGRFAMGFCRAVVIGVVSNLAAMAAELQAEISAGRLMVESLANSVTARPVQTYISAPAAQSVASLARGGIDRRRLFRVLDYIEANPEGDLTLIPWHRLRA